MKKKNECLGREKCLALANAVLNDMDCHPAFVKAMAADESNFKVTEQMLDAGFAVINDRGIFNTNAMDYGDLRAIFKAILDAKAE